MMAVATLALLGGVVPAHAETANWATYAIASTQYSDGNLASAAGPIAEVAFCAAFSMEVCPPAPEDIGAGVDQGTNGALYGSWSAMQATGAPDTNACGDIPTAWAPLLSGHEPETAGLDAVAEPEALAAVYDPPVDGATRIDIYESNLGSFVQAVVAILADGTPVTVFAGSDTTPCGGVLSIPVTTSAPIAAVGIVTAKVGWEEIDAVGVIN